MNTTDLQDLYPADRAFAQAARAGLRASEGLNYVESARLAATRARARDCLMQSRPAMPASAWFAASAAVLVVAVALLRLDFSSPETPQSTVQMAMFPPTAVNADAVDALVWVSDEAGPDFYRDLEFYEWLQSRSRMEPNA